MSVHMTEAIHGDRSVAHVCWEPNLDLLQEYEEFIAAEPPFQPLSFYLFYETKIITVPKMELHYNIKS